VIIALHDTDLFGGDRSLNVLFSTSFLYDGTSMFRVTTSATSAA